VASHRIARLRQTGADRQLEEAVADHRVEPCEIEPARELGLAGGERDAIVVVALEPERRADDQPGRVDRRGARGGPVQPPARAGLRCARRPARVEVAACVEPEPTELDMPGGAEQRALAVRVVLPGGRDIDRPRRHGARRGGEPVAARGDPDVGEPRRHDQPGAADEQRYAGPDRVRTAAGGGDRRASGDHAGEADHTGRRELAGGAPLTDDPAPGAAHQHAGKDRRGDRGGAAISAMASAREHNIAKA
jgi:hypothetical protein